MRREPLATRTQIQNGSRNLRLFLERLGIGVERTSEVRVPVGRGIAEIELRSGHALLHITPVVAAALLLRISDR
jgi:hypothetical protein